MQILSVSRLFFVAIVLASAVFAQAGAMQPMANASAPTAAAQVMTAGQIRKIDTAAGTLTIKHAAILNLQMPPMVMEFKVAKPAMLTQVKVGDHIRFHAESSGDDMLITKLEVVH